MSTDRLTADDIDTIVEAIEHFVIGPQYPEDPELRETWQPYIDKLNALKSGDPGVAVAPKPNVQDDWQALQQIVAEETESRPGVAVAPPRQLLDARAHCGDGDSAAREAGAVVAPRDAKEKP